MKIKKKLISDMLINIVATAIPTLVLQLFILPSLAGKMSDERYGLLVTVLALMNTIPSTFGNTLNNIRLLYDEKYKSACTVGDYNILLIIMTVVNFVIVTVVSVLFDKEITFFTLFLNLLVSVLWLTKEYFIVAFRLIIDYKAILINNILHVAGYGIGYVLFLYSGSWQFIYILGYLVSNIFIFFKCSLWKEPLKKTRFFKVTSIQGFWLLIANIFNRFLTYADKLVIFPILGGATVSVYYASTVFGKVVSLLITPINSVALTYLSKIKKKSDDMFKWSVLSGGFICLIGYVALVLVSRPVLGILYPQYVDEAMKYIPVTTGTAVMYAMISIVNPFIIKFFNLKWQTLINGLTMVLYITLCLTFLHFFGLQGFCIGALITNVIKFVLMIFINYKCKEL